MNSFAKKRHRSEKSRPIREQNEFEILETRPSRKSELFLRSPTPDRSETRAQSLKIPSIDKTETSTREHSNVPEGHEASDASKLKFIKLIGQGSGGKVIAAVLGN